MVVKPAHVQDIRNSEPFEELNHSKLPAGSKAELTSIKCHNPNCEAKGHTDYASMRAVDSHLKSIDADFSGGDIPFLCRECADRFNYKDAIELEKEDLLEDVELHGDKLRDLNR